MRPFDTLIFDFDGTIADTLNVFVHIYNKVLAPTFKIKPMSETDTANFRSHDPRELFKGLGVNIITLPFIVARARDELNNSISEIKPHYGIISLLERLYRSGLKLGICTSNSQSNVSTFLRTNSISDFFQFIYTGKNLFGKHRVLQKAIREQELQKETTLFIGDEIRDIEAAHRLGLKAVAVTWGYNSRDAFKVVIPDHFIDTPEQLLRLTE